MALVDKAFSTRDVLIERSAKTNGMQPASLSGRQQQLGLLMGRAQPDMLEAARVAALLNGQSNSFNLQSGLGTGLGSGGLAGLGAAPAGLNLSLGSLQQGPQSAPQSSQLGLPDQLALLSQFPHALFPQQYGSTERDLQLGSLRNVGKTRSSDSRSSSAYASRHQAAEQRRRTRINERLELLRKLVPHAERANTACFLEEVIKYIEALKRRTLELEVMLEAATGKPVAKSLAMPGALGPVLESAPDSQAPSPRLPANSTGPPTTSAQQLGGGQAGASGASPSPQLTPTLTPASQQQQPQQQSQQASEQPPSLRSLESASLQQLQLSQAAASQLAQLLPSPAQPPSSAPPPQPASQLPSLQASQPPQSAALFSVHSGGLSLGGGGSLSLSGSGLHPVSLAHLTAGLQAQQHHGLPSHSQSHLGSLPHTSAHLSAHHHHMVQQLSDLQSMHALQSLQQQVAGGRSSGHPPAFHPTNNKAFLHFNEDLFSGIRPELLGPSRSLLGAAASTTPSTSLQLTTAQLPTDSNTLVHAGETARKTLSGSPATSEESGVPLKKRKVLML